MTARVGSEPADVATFSRAIGLQELLGWSAKMRWQWRVYVLLIVALTGQCEQDVRFPIAWKAEELNNTRCAVMGTVPEYIGRLCVCIAMNHPIQMVTCSVKWQERLVT